MVGSTVPVSDPRLQSGTTGTRSSLAISFYPESFVNHTWSGNKNQFRPGEVEPNFHIDTPEIIDTILYPTYYYIDRFIKGKGDLPLQRVLRTPREEWWLMFYWVCMIPPERRGFDEYGYPKYDSKRKFTIVSPSSFYSFGYKKGKRYPRLWVKEYEREDLGDIIRYHISFGFEGDLDYGFERLSDLQVREGSLDMRFELPKHE
jgi:hypothetical protein